MSSTESRPRRLLVWLALVIAIVWPPVYSLVVQPRLASSIDPHQVSIDDPLVGVGALAYREDGVVESGDWLIAGSHGEVQVGPDLQGDFGVQIVLHDPKDDAES